MSPGTADQWRIRPGTTLDLAATNTRGAGPPDTKDEAAAELDDLAARLGELQERLWAERRRSVLVVLQALDAGGKDGTIKHLFRCLNPVGARVASFRSPTEEELAHDFLWRIHRHTPAGGELVVFNRSHYEDVVAVRVRRLAPEDTWRPRYRAIREFERTLTEAGTAVVKLFLHITKEEQAERLRERLEDRTKHWKFRVEDLDDRALWDQHQVAYQEAVAETSTDWAPWYVVPADRKWFRNWAVSQILIETLVALDPQYPQVEGLDGVVVV